jgi:hypothetical protein
LLAAAARCILVGMGPSRARLVHAVASAFALTLIAACGSGSQASNKMVNAAIDVGIAAAAMPIHQAIYGCVTACAYGTGCDEATGTCVDLEELAKQQRNKQARVAGDPNQPPQPPLLGAYDEDCGGMCMSDERCVMYRGDLECVPK